MTGIDFPSNPSVNQQFSAFGNVWIWNGSSWRKVSGMTFPRRSTLNYVA